MSIITKELDNYSNITSLVNGGQKKVFVGMSGGVDSSVSAALLKEAGFDVTGVFIKTWHPDFIECSWREDRQDAMRVCAELGIPFETLDLEEEYKRNVADYMIAEYAGGRTPNPDVMCNKHVKFGAFFKAARARGADMIATGHYARIQETPQYQLLRGVDLQKDQSYFLWTLTPDILEHTLFPVGDMTKAEVRECARRFGLPVAEKKDSQGVCFLGHVDMKEFLKRFITVTPGDVLDEDENVIGRHGGALLYTLGERRGFTVTKKSPTDGPWYVVAKDLAKNTVTVSQRESVPTIVQTRRIKLHSVNWIGAPAALGQTLECRFRYRQPLMPCVVEMRDGAISVVFESPKDFVSPGQSLVLYDNERCLGGGIIESTSPDA